MLTAEWGQLPTYTIMYWGFIFLMNVYNFLVLKDFSVATPGTPTPMAAKDVTEENEFVEEDTTEDDLQILKKGEKMTELRQKAIEILSNSME